MNDRSPEHSAQEQQAFERFLKAYPSFARTVAYHSPSPGAFPDIDAHLGDGTIISVELGEWIDGRQLAEALKSTGSEPAGGAYDPGVALAAVRQTVEKKLVHYGPSARGAWLIIHYSRGLLYNTPFRGLSVHGFEDVARVVSQLLKQRQVYFEKVFLLAAWGDMDERLVKILRDAGIPFVAGPEAFEVFLSFNRCESGAKGTV